MRRAEATTHGSEIGYGMANIMSREKRANIVRFLMEGMSVRGVCRTVKSNINTILRQTNLLGGLAQRFMLTSFAGLHFNHLEIDETWTFVSKKNAQLTEQEALRDDIGSIYLWIAVDRDSRLVPHVAVGKQVKSMAVAFMQHLSANHTVNQISTDSLSHYIGAVNEAFGDWVKHGTTLKDRVNSPGVILARRAHGALREDELHTVNTNRCERQHLTLRHFTNRVSRGTPSFSRKLSNLTAHAYLYYAYYNYCWKIGGTATPAMRIGIASHPWTIERLCDELTGYANSILPSDCKHHYWVRANGIHARKCCLCGTTEPQAAAVQCSKLLREMGAVK